MIGSLRVELGCEYFLKYEQKGQPISNDRRDDEKVKYTTAKKETEGVKVGEWPSTWTHSPTPRTLPQRQLTL